jgi:hypothetical protein
MRALASNLEASRTFEAPFRSMLKPNVDLGPQAPVAPHHRIPRLSCVNAFGTPRRRPKTGWDHRW